MVSRSSVIESTVTSGASLSSSGKSLAHDALVRPEVIQLVRLPADANKSTVGWRGSLRRLRVFAKSRQGLSP